MLCKNAQCCFTVLLQVCSFALSCSFSHMYVRIQCTQSMYSCTHSYCAHTHYNTEIEREERSRGLPFRAERQSQEEIRRREELQQRVVEAERRAQEESRRADRAQQRAREMEGRVREESGRVAGAGRLTSPNTHIERQRLKGLLLYKLS